MLTPLDVHGFPFIIDMSFILFPVNLFEAFRANNQRFTSHVKHFLAPFRSAFQILHFTCMINTAGITIITTQLTYPCA